MSTSSPTLQQKNAAILLVDDDNEILAILQKILKKAFDAKTALSGEEALEILEHGFMPNVIISDYNMPGINGGEFLKKSMEYVPEATRILLSEETENKVILPALSKCQAMMYIAKPFKNLDVFQYSMLALNLHKKSVKCKKFESILNKNEQPLLDTIATLESKVSKLFSDLDIETELRKAKESEIKELREKFKEVNELFLQLKAVKENDSQLIEDYSEQIQDQEIADNIANHFETDDVGTTSIKMSRESVLAFSSYIRELNRFSFTDHTYAVSLLAKEICRELDFSEKQTNLTITSALLHNFPIVVMPNFFQIAYPNRLQLKFRERYFYLFEKQMRILRFVENLEGVTDNISKLWEHSDGTGNPKNIGSREFNLEAQVLAISNFYAFNVYRATEKDLRSIREKHFCIQGKETNLKRHIEAKNIIVKNRSWYDHKVVEAFQYLMNEEKSKLIDLIDISGKIDYRDMIKMDDLDELKDVRNLYDNLIVEHYEEDLLLDYGSSKGDSMIKKREIIPLNDLKPGMILSDDIKSNTSSVILKAGTEVTSESIRNLLTLAAKEMIESDIQVMVPYKE
jgi:response regulator RpfG family c-di-GMP phosphodiesterase